jgi:hypothetical protein
MVLTVTAIISLNSVNQFMIIMVKCSVLFEVRPEFLIIISTKSGFKELVVNKVGE